MPERISEYMPERMSGYVIYNPLYLLLKPPPPNGKHGDLFLLLDIIRGYLVLGCP